MTMTVIKDGPPLRSTLPDTLPKIVSNVEYSSALVRSMQGLQHLIHLRILHGRLPAGMHGFRRDLQVILKP
jgi:hypothetical protein